MAVYLEKQGNEGDAPALCKHAAIVRELASLHADWLCMMSSFVKLEQEQVGIGPLSIMNYTVKLLLMGCQHKSFTKIAARPKGLDLLIILETKQVVDITSSFVTLGFQGTEPLEPAGYTTQARTAGGASMITSVGTANAPGCRHTTDKPSNKKTVQTSPVPNPRIHNRNLPTPINPNKLGQLLVSANYPADLTKNLLEGFEAGFSIGFQGDRSSAMQSKNLKSYDNLESVVEQKLEKEIAKDRISSGYATPPYPNLFCSPIGLVPKKSRRGVQINSPFVPSKGYVH